MHGWTRIGRRLGTLGLGALSISFVVSLALYSGCKQGENERCQIDSDCDEDHYCYYSSGNDKIIGGTCRSRTATNTAMDLSTPTPPADMMQPPDMTATDM